MSNTQAITAYVFSLVKAMEKASGSDLESCVASGIAFLDGVESVVSADVRCKLFRMLLEFYTRRRRVLDIVSA